MNSLVQSAGHALSPKRISVLYLLAIILVAFGLLTPDLFLSQVTFQAVFSSQAAPAMLALAVLLPLICGEFDISVGSNMGLALAVVCWQSALHPERSLLAICVGAVLLCGLAGVVNGILVVKLHVSSFIGTLAMSQVLAAAALKISDNKQLLGVFPAGFAEFGQSVWFGVPAPFWCVVVVGVVLYYVLEWTKLGRHMMATGMNREAARLSGVRADALIIGSFAASGVIAGLAGVLYAAQVGIFSNTIAGGLIFPAFAAVFLGSTQFNRRPNVPGTFVAILTLAIGVQGLQLTLTSGGFWITPMFNGLSLAVAVAFGAHQLRVSRRSGEPAAAAPAEVPGGEGETGPSVHAETPGSQSKV